jgi:hypothetical protein
MSFFKPLYFFKPFLPAVGVMVSSVTPTPFAGEGDSLGLSGLLAGFGGNTAFSSLALLLVIAAFVFYFSEKY